MQDEVNLNLKKWLCAWIQLIIYPTQQKIFSLLHIKHITKSTLMIMFMIAGRCEGHWYDNIHVVMYSDPGLRVNIKYPLYPAPAVRTMASLDTWHVSHCPLSLMTAQYNYGEVDQ